MRDRLIEKIDNFCKKELGANFNKDIIGNFTDHLLENGVIVPPCKVGDIIYTVFEGKIETLNIIRAMTEESTERFNRYYDAENKFLKMPFVECHIGKTVFLTREEAEKALKGGVE